LENFAPGEDASDVDFDSGSYAASFDGPGGKDVGLNKPVTVTGVDVQGPEAGNYTISQPTGLTADINKRNLTFDQTPATNPPQADDKTYDGTDDATVDFTGATLENFASGEDSTDVNFDAGSYDATFDGPGGKTTGTGLIGFEPETGKFTSVWIDSRQTRMSLRSAPFIWL